MTIVIHKIPGIFESKYQTEYELNYGGKAILEEIVNILANIDLKREKVLILVKLKSKVGSVIEEILKKRGFCPTFLSGDSKKEFINQSIRDFNTGKIDILIGSSVIGQGIDVKAAHHFIMAQGQKSAINVVQGAGRLVRLYPGKEVGVYHDFKFVGTKFMNRHLATRIRTLKENFAPKELVEI